MSTIKSDDSNITINASGSGRDIKFQANGVEKASISSAGAFTSTTIDATKLTGNLPAISGASLTNLPAASQLDHSGTKKFEATASGVKLTGTAGTSPILELNNADTEDNDTGRETSLRFTGNRSGGEDVINAQVSGHHDGSADDDKGLMLFYTNNGSGLQEAMRINSSGIVTKANNPAFAARYSSATTGNWNGEWFIPNNTNSFGCNVGGHYNGSNGRFVAPVAGSYFFSMNIRQDDRTGAYWYIDLYLNGTFRHRALNDADNSYDQLSLSGVIPMAANDYVQARINTVGDTSSTVHDESSFSGFLIG